jgi:hypothetical protein
MNMKNVWTVLLFLLVFTNIVNNSDSLSAEESVFEINLSIIPEGIDLGMSVEKLRGIRPEALVFDLGEYLDNKKKVDDLSVGEHLLIEEIKGQRTKTGVCYSIKNGRLVSISAGVEGIIEEIRELRKSMLRESIAHFGDKYEKMVAKESNAYVNILIPVMIWKTKDVDVAFKCTSEYKYVELLKGSVQVNISLKDGYSVLTGIEDADKGTIDFLMAPLEAEIEESQGVE